MKSVLSYINMRMEIALKVRNMRNELNKLSDRELNDIGISRVDIDTLCDQEAAKLKARFAAKAQGGSNVVARTA